MTHSTREVEEWERELDALLHGYIAIKDTQACMYEGEAIVSPDELKSFIAHQLQKAREEEREETREILRCISRIVETSATNLENYILGQMPIVHSELDQDKK